MATDYDRDRAELFQKIKTLAENGMVSPEEAKKTIFENEYMGLYANTTTTSSGVSLTAGDLNKTYEQMAGYSPYPWYVQLVPSWEEEYQKDMMEVRYRYDKFYREITNLFLLIDKNIQTI